LPIGAIIVRWQYCWNTLLVGLVWALHGLHAGRDAPETFDDPHFFDKVILVLVGVGTFILGHKIQEEERKLKSTHK
jgi:hypothetical protein